jgi:hypothetical protein
MLAPTTGSLYGISVAESSVTLPPDPRRSTMFHISQPSCPTCATTTMLARIAHGFSGLDIRTFECPVCDHIHQIVIDLADPMKSTKINGWLHGQLQAPT